VPSLCPPTLAGSTALARAELESEQKVQRVRSELIEVQERSLVEAQAHQARESEWRAAEARLHDQYRAELETKVSAQVCVCPVVSVCVVCVSVWRSLRSHPYPSACVPRRQRSHPPTLTPACPHQHPPTPPTPPSCQLSAVEVAADRKRSEALEQFARSTEHAVREELALLSSELRDKRGEVQRMQGVIHDMQTTLQEQQRQYSSRFEEMRQQVGGCCGGMKGAPWDTVTCGAGV
jgi:hypothetical protein